MSTKDEIVVALREAEMHHFALSEDLWEQHQEIAEEFESVRELVLSGDELTDDDMAVVQRAMVGGRPMTTSTMEGRELG